MRVLACVPVLALLAGCAVTPMVEPADLTPGFELSLTAGARDAAGHILGGTEMRALVAYQGKLYAANGFWEDRSGPGGRPGPQILVLDGPSAGWRQETSFDERLPDGRRRHLAISALHVARFTTDGDGRALPAPVSMLLAASWDLGGNAQVFSRDDATGAWTAMTIVEDRPTRDFLPQVRAFASYRDRVTGVDLVFAGHGPRGIFSGSYDRAQPGRIRWATKPELDAAGVTIPPFPGLDGRLRVSSFAVCNGQLHAAVGQQVYRRNDGPSPTWQAIYTNPRPAYSQTGLRGLTAIANPSGPGDVLLAAVEGNSARIVRIDPRSGADATDLDLDGFLNQTWQSRVSYVIAAYNDMTRLPSPSGDRLLIGLEAFIPRTAPQPPGHLVVDGIEGGAWFLVREPDGRYHLRKIADALPATRTPLVATRAILASPFPGDAALYFAGYDANHRAARDTGWIIRGGIDF